MARNSTAFSISTRTRMQCSGFQAPRPAAATFCRCCCVQGKCCCACLAISQAYLVKTEKYTKHSKHAEIKTLSESFEEIGKKDLFEKLRISGFCTYAKGKRIPKKKWYFSTRAPCFSYFWRNVQKHRRLCSKRCVCVVGTMLRLTSGVSRAWDTT